MIMKMKRYTIMMSLATALLGLGACSSEDGTDNMTGTAYLQLTTEIATSRAIIDATAFNTGDQVDLFYSTANGSGQTRAVCDNGKWSISPAVTLDGNSVGIAGIANFGKGDITPDENGEQNDILLGLPNKSNYTYINAANPIVPMKFHHVLARVSFQVKSVGGNEELTRLSLKNIDKGSAISTRYNDTAVEYARSLANNMRQDAIYSSKWNEFQTRMQEYLVKYRQPATLTLNKTLTLTENVQTIDLLVIPTTINSSNRVALELAIDGNVYSVELPYTTWSSNCKYVYPVNIDVTKDWPNAVSISSVVIAPWTSSGEGNVENTWNMD